MRLIEGKDAFTLEDLQQRRYDSAVEESFRTGIRRMRVRAWMIAAAVVCVFSAVTLVLWLGARSVLHGTMTGGELAQFLSYAIFMATAVTSLSEMWGEVQRAAGAMERTVELLESRPSIRMPERPIALEAPTGRIRFEHLSFNYPSRPDVRALDDFHQAPALQLGQRAALHDAHAVADLGLALFVVGVKLLVGRHDLLELRMAEAPFHADHDGLGHLVGDDFAGALFAVAADDVGLRHT